MLNNIAHRKRKLEAHRNLILPKGTGDFIGWFVSFVSFYDISTSVGYLGPLMSLRTSPANSEVIFLTESESFFEAPKSS